MTRDDLIATIEEAIDNVHDMGVTSRDYAVSVADALGPLLDAADALAANLENCLVVLPKEDERLCCDGRECGCYGATVHQEAEHYAKEALSTYRAAKEALQ